MTDPARVLALFAGPVAPLGPRGVASAFVKHRLGGPVRAGVTGLEGDAQADLTVHGGPDKAVYVYPSGHYGAWVRAFPEHASMWKAGALGENLSVTELDESSVAIGDIFQVGTALVQVTQPRRPCHKLTLRFGDKRIAGRMLSEGWTGWYVRVLEPGRLCDGDAVELRERPNPAWSVARVNAAAHGIGTPDDVLRSIASLPELSGAWREQMLAGLAMNTARPQL